jgi:AcrR family transcriptional regulator
VEARSHILEAGFRVLARDGVAGLSLRAVAKEAGVTPMAIYRHYSDKDDLVNALVMAGLSAWTARVAAIPGVYGAQKLERVGRAFLEFALDEPAAFDAAFALPGRDARRFPEDFLGGKSPAGNLILAWTKDAMAEGRLRRGDPLEVWISLWALAQGLIALYRAARFSGGRRAFEAIYDRALARCLASFSTGQAT